MLSAAALPVRLSLSRLLPFTVTFRVTLLMSAGLVIAPPNRPSSKSPPVVSLAKSMVAVMLAVLVSVRVAEVALPPARVPMAKIFGLLPKTVLMTPLAARMLRCRWWWRRRARR
jgi:hypothetical protein